MEYKYFGTKLKIHRISYYFRSLLILLKEIEPKRWLRFFIDLLLPKIKTVKLKKRKLVFQFFQCSFLKMDCEGCEFSVINDKSALLLKRVKKIVLEYHENEDRKKERLESILTREKFKVSFFSRMYRDRM